MPWCHPLGVDGRRCVLSRRTVLRFTLRNGRVDLVQIQLPSRARQNHAGAPCNPHSPDDCWLESKSSEIAPTYVSPITYQSHSCQQLAAEAQRVSAAAAAAAGHQDSQASKDAVATTVGVIVFWPTLFLIGGDKQNAAQLANLKGQMDAIEQASIQKQCGR